MRHRRNMLFLALLALPALCSAAEETLLGSLYVTTTPPGAAVYVNGELRGVSPCGIGDVATGTVEVRAERQGFGTATTDVDVKGGKITRVDLSMPPLAGVGSLAVLVEPQGSDIEVDRVAAGRTPKVVINVRAGTHRVSVSRPGFLPMHSTVSLAPGEESVLSGALQPAVGAAAPSSAPTWGTSPTWSRATSPPPPPCPRSAPWSPCAGWWPRAATTPPSSGLKQMTDGASAELVRRIGRERLVILSVREVVDAAYKRLREVKGQDYVLLLRGGIRYPCTVVDVTDTDVKVRIGEREQSIPLSSVSAEQVVRLASHSMDPARSASHAKFALLYAAEGDYDAAYDELRSAADGGYDVSSDKSYVDAERLWAAAVKKEASLRVLAQSGSASDVLKAGRVLKVVPLLVDTYHGRPLPDELRKLAQASAFDIRTQAAAFGDDEVAHPAVLVIYDPGAGATVPPYDQPGGPAHPQLRQGRRRAALFRRRAADAAARRPPDAGGGRPLRRAAALDGRACAARVDDRQQGRAGRLPAPVRAGLSDGAASGDGRRAVRRLRRARCAAGRRPLRACAPAGQLRCCSARRAAGRPRPWRRHRTSARGAWSSSRPCP